MDITIKEKLRNRAAQMEAALLTHLFHHDADIVPLARLADAERYAAAGGGKRLRPFLLIEAAVLCGARAETALPAACAIEMIHSYSLVHDDLPAMDDSDTRRGKPSVHRQFDEAIAILAGDGLLTDAFAVLTGGAYPPPTATALVHVLSVAAGSAGMVGGQMMDLYPPELTADSIVAIQARKTGALIEAAAVMGGLVAEADGQSLKALRGYARALGLAFQIVDDILDVTRTAEELGKPSGADEEAGKATFVSLLGLDGARAEVDRLTERAQAALSPFGLDAVTFIHLADDLAQRTR